jgi:SAM-dependent methyltransferase
MSDTDFAVNENAAVYYTGRYWNDLKAVRDRLNERVAGDPDVEWSTHFARRTGRTFGRALILNCGNGHVERGLVRDGVVAEAVGIDYSHDLLDEARREAAADGLPLRYHQMDVNTVAFPDDEFDLVVNFAAGHHIACIDRVFRELCRRLPDDGWFVAWDYIGAHRNQYPYEAWEAAHQLNQGLPERFRQDMRYPHLPTMLATDPTEAIHAELIEETFRRYFTVDELVRLGGEIAYPLLTHNDAFWAQPDDEDRAAVVEQILDADAAYLAGHPATTLFAYFAGQPDKGVLDRADELDRWRAAEDERESAGAANGGEYYPRTALQAAMLELEDQRVAAEHARAWATEVQAKWDHLTGMFPYRQAKALSHHPTVEKLRANPTVAAVERRLSGGGPS